MLLKSLSLKSCGIWDPAFTTPWRVGWGAQLQLSTRNETGLGGKRRLTGGKSLADYAITMKETWWRISKTGFLLISASAENLCLWDSQRLKASLWRTECRIWLCKMLFRASSLKCSAGYLSPCSKSTNISPSTTVPITSRLFIFESHSPKGGRSICSALRDWKAGLNLIREL